MKKTTTKSPSKASQKKAVRDLDVKPATSGTVHGGKQKPDGTVAGNVKLGGDKPVKY